MRQLSDSAVPGSVHFAFPLCPRDSKKRGTNVRRGIHKYTNLYKEEVYKCKFQMYTNVCIPYSLGYFELLSIVVPYCEVCQCARAHFYLLRMPLCKSNTFRYWSSRGALCVRHKVKRFPKSLPRHPKEVPKVPCRHKTIPLIDRSSLFQKVL